jgi:putative ABC transport system substrate-binding protein
MATQPALAAGIRARAHPGVLAAGGSRQAAGRNAGSLVADQTPRTDPRRAWRMGGLAMPGGRNRAGLPPVLRALPPRARWSVRTAALLALLLPQGAPADEVLAVLSEDTAPYRLAEEGLGKALSAAGHHLTGRLLEAPVAPAEAGRFSAVVAIGSKAAGFLHDHRPPAVPVVFCMVADPVLAGLTAEPRLGGVVTEVPLGVQLALIAEALPQARTLGLLYRGDLERSRAQLAGLQALLPSSWRLEAVGIEAANSVAEAIDSLFARPIDVVWTAPESTIFTEATVRTLLLNALRKRVPVFGFSPSFVRAGALVGIGINPLTQGAQSAAMVLGRINGETAADGQLIPPDYEIEVNLVVARKLALDLPAALVGRATQIYQAGR